VACREGFPAVVELLLSRGSAISAPADPATGTAAVPNAIASTCEGEWSPAKHAMLELLLETASSQATWASSWRGGLSQAAVAHNHAAFDLIMEYLPPTAETLALASRCGSLPSITHHLKAGITPQTPTTDGRFPLHETAFNLHPTAVSSLLTQGADVNQLDRKGTTPLLSALLGFHALLNDTHPSHEYQADMGIVQFEEIVQCLLDHGARTGRGETPFGKALDLARLIGHKEVERLLQERATQDSGLDRFERIVVGYCRATGQEGRELLEGYEPVMGKDVAGYCLDDEDDDEGDDKMNVELDDEIDVVDDELGSEIDED
jgi:hypothetical protein